MAANERMVNGVKTRLLHNKDYVEVAERLRIAHAVDEGKTFEMIESGPMEIGTRIIWKVAVKFDGRLFIGHAEAKLDAPKNSPDGTNPFECAETSAMGRALAFAGLGTLESIASYDEIARGKPFEAMVQPVSNRTIDAPRDEQRQIASTTAPTPDEALKQRMNAIYKRAYALHQFEKAATNEETFKNFIGFVASVLDIKVTSSGQLTSSRMDAVEKYLDSKDAA